MGGRLGLLERLLELASQHGEATRGVFCSTERNPGEPDDDLKKCAKSLGDQIKGMRPCLGPTPVIQWRACMIMMRERR